MPGYVSKPSGSIVWADNIDTSGGNPATEQVTTDGQLLIGSTASPNIRVGTITAGSGISVVNGSGSITISATASGDVSGPGSSTDNAIARFDGTTGKIIQNSGVTIDDSDNVAGATSITIDPGASGDSWVQFDINSVNKWRVGVDDDDSDKFKISSGGALGTNDTFIMTSAGERTMPLQPAFYAYSTTANSNITGDGTEATIAFDSELFDQGGDFSSNTFTAPVSGRYCFGHNINFQALDASMTSGVYYINTSNTKFVSSTTNPSVEKNGSNVQSVNSMVICDMDAADTVDFRATISGSTKTVDCQNSINLNYCFGYLAV